MRSSWHVLRVGLAAGLLAGANAGAGCDTVDLGAPPADVNACRPSQQFFYEQVWPGYLGKAYAGGKHCYDRGCHGGGSGRQLVLQPPSSPPGLPLPADWAALYKSASEQMQCTNARASALLTRADGRQTHGGGKLIEPGGEETLLVEMWVAARP